MVLDNVKCVLMLLTQYFLKWREIAFLIVAKTAIDIIYKFQFTYTPFLISHFQLDLQQWGAILALQELMTLSRFCTTAIFRKFSSYRVTSFFMLMIAMVNVLQTFGFADLIDNTATF